MFLAGRKACPRYETKIERIPYLNYGLAMGHRVKSDPTITTLTVQAVYKKLHEGFSDERTDTVRYLLFHKNSELMRFSTLINGERFTPNWYAPTLLGGLGLPVRIGVPVFFTPIQRKVASYLSRNPLEGWLHEKLTSLPTGAQNGLRDWKLMTSGIVPRSRKPIGPLRYEDSMQYLEDRLGMILGAHAWDYNLETGDSLAVKRFKINRRAVSTQPQMNVHKILSYVFDYVPENSSHPINAPHTWSEDDFDVWLGLEAVPRVGISSQDMETAHLARPMFSDFDVLQED